MTTPDPIYTRSNGTTVRVAEMVTNHLKSALAKLQREFPGHPEIGPMADEAARRDADFADRQAAFEHSPVVADHEMEDPFQ